MNKFPYPEYCSWTCQALRERLVDITVAAERAAVLYILEYRMRRAAFEG